MAVEVSMKLSVARPGSPAWNEAWDALRADVGDTVATCPITGEVWQYMGTVDGTHEFRHRHHPEIGRRMVRGYRSSGLSTVAPPETVS